MVNNIVVISDTHCGCRLGLCPPKVTLDENGVYEHSPLQEKVWGMWKYFHDEWIPEVTQDEDYILVHNGDAIDGEHHKSVTQISHNIDDQINIARECLEPVIAKPHCKGYYHVRGTEAHVGQSAQNEESLARQLGAIPAIVNDRKTYARWDMWMDFGQNNRSLIHFTHHVGTSNSAAYESTAVYKELVEAYNEAGRFGDEPPDAVIRSHRHRQFEIKIATTKGHAYSIVTPGWQLKTPFVYRLGLGRSSTPQIGGYLLRVGQEDTLYTRFKVWKIERTKTIRV